MGRVPILTALCRVDRLQPDSGSVGVTAIDKRPAEGPLTVRRLGVHGDVQANRVHHGGPDKAVYAFADEDAAHFGAMLGYPVTPGLFGENLRTSGLDVTGAVIGERWRVGGALVLEVTMPRTPCATFQRRLREPRWVARFQQEGRPGAYLRVTTTGPIAAGDEITVLDRPEHGVTIGDCFAGLSAAQARALLDSPVRLGAPVAKVARVAVARG